MNKLQFLKFVSILFLSAFFLIVPDGAHSAVCTSVSCATLSDSGLVEMERSQAVDATRSASQSASYNPTGARTSVYNTREALYQIDRSFDDERAFLGPNPTAEQRRLYYEQVSAYRRALPGMFGGFENLDQLLGADDGEPGLITKGITAAASVDALMRTFMGGAEGLIGQDGAEIIGKLVAAENTINLISNFGNTGLGTLREGQLALSSIGQLFPGIAGKIAPVTQALGAFANLEQSFSGMTSSFGGLSRNIPNMKSAISGSSLMGRGDTSGGSRFQEPFGRSPADRKVVSAAGITGKSAADAKASGEKLTGDATKAGEGTEAAAEEGVSPGGRSVCAPGSAGKKDKGVPIDSQSLLILQNKIEYAQKKSCEEEVRIREVQDKVDAKELKGLESKDAKATEIAKNRLKQARLEWEQERAQKRLKEDGEDKGPVYVDLYKKAFDDIRKRRTKNTISDVKEVLPGERGQKIAEQLEKEEQARYDEKESLKLRLGMEQGGDPDQELAQMEPQQQFMAYLFNPQYYSYNQQVQTVRDERQRREDEAVEEAVQELYWNNGYFGEREVAEKDADGNPRTFVTTIPGKLIEERDRVLKVSSFVDEEIGVDTDTDPRTGQAPEGAKEVRSQSSAGGGGVNPMQALQQTLQTIQTLKQLLGGDDNTGGRDGNNPTRPPDVLPERPIAPTILFSEISTATLDGSLSSIFSWKAENANRCVAVNDWITYGDTDPGDPNARAPRSATTIPQMMLLGDSPIRSGTLLPTEGFAMVYHPQIFKATLRSEKATQNAGAIADQKDTATVSFVRDSLGKLIQRVALVPNIENLEVSDWVIMDIPGVSFSTQARAPVSAQGISGALAVFATEWEQGTSGLRDLDIFNVGETLFAQAPVPAEVALSENAIYTIACEGAGGAEVTSSATVRFGRGE
ncbi:MAG: hypothetical protein COV07_00875 [Candidatus Vogelbacteria bacterium CG10_big_fil_rev_8_21_14_0_10_45_14]|uniref:Uncharacterized protein n=1 Tax=Candidatus Vogelbacteria bacterium CG10_big_fil_rev_8_21_14_0_10_45_14 TaxID=1975042 RepID=A0A2H0RKJ9_9BACT|nr:MAG: hypothetical protein COV07_00875 [Candidatus Vogelbacteria bacterium CG10_big_fil_rev_8_21_14_0_10_45_14]